MEKGIGGGCATAAARQPQVIEQLSRLEDAVGRLMNTVTDLESRTTSVVRQEPRGKSEAGIVQNLVPVAESIRGAVSRIEETSDRIVDLMGRCEL